MASPAVLASSRPPPSPSPTSTSTWRALVHGEQIRRSSSGQGGGDCAAPCCVSARWPSTATDGVPVVRRRRQGRTTGFRHFDAGYRICIILLKYNVKNNFHLCTCTASLLVGLQRMHVPPLSPTRGEHSTRPVRPPLPSRSLRRLDSHRPREPARLHDVLGLHARRPPVVAADAHVGDVHVDVQVVLLLDEKATQMLDSHLSASGSVRAAPALSTATLVRRAIA